MQPKNFPSQFRRAGLLCVLGCTALAASAANAEGRQPSPEAIARLVESGMQQYGMVGAALVVLQDGRPVFSRGFGSADLERDVPVRSDTLFQSGSVGKMFTATGIVLLAQQGKLSLDDALAKFFPDGPEYWQRAKLRDVLRHRAGVPNPSFSGKDPTRLLDLKRDISGADLVRAISAWPMEFEPGTRYQYSNSGYMLLGLVIERVTGQFYGDFLRTQLFVPLAMQTARVNEPFEIVRNRAQSYLVEDGELRHIDFVSRTFNQTADGSLLLTIQDLAQWDAALRQASFLPRPRLEEMFAGEPYPDATLGVTNYGFGWETRDVRGHRLVDHTGYWQGFSTYLGRYVDDGLTVAMLTNARNDNVRLLSLRVAGLFDPAYGPFEPIEDRDPRLTRKLHDIAREYIRGRAARGAFDATAASSIAPKQMARVANEVTLNPDAPFVLVEHGQLQGRRSYVYLWGDDPDATFTVHIELRPNGKVARIRFQPA
jgi:CubicO group peptidase (beta-lactamase class C family)